MVKVSQSKLIHNCTNTWMSLPSFWIFNCKFNNKNNPWRISFHISSNMLPYSYIKQLVCKMTKIFGIVLKDIWTWNFEEMKTNKVNLIITVKCYKWSIEQVCCFLLQLLLLSFSRAEMITWIKVEWLRFKLLALFFSFPLFLQDKRW